MTDLDPFRDAENWTDCSCGAPLGWNDEDGLPQNCSFCGAEVNHPKRFRVLVVQRQYIHVDVEAQSPQHAIDLVDEGNVDVDFSMSKDREIEGVEAEEIG